MSSNGWGGVRIPFVLTFEAKPVRRYNGAMLRILHTSDIHIGVENYSRVNPETGLSTRLEDFLRVFDEAVDFAVREGVDLFLFCGDAYKSRDPSQTHQREFAKRIARLVKEGVSVFLLVGNHDLPNAFGRATSLEIYSTLPLTNVTVGEDFSTYVVETRKGPVQVLALPWARRAKLMAREEMRGMTFPQVNEEIQRRIIEGLRQKAEELDSSLPAVLAAHVTVTTAKLSSERSMMLGNDYVLPPSALALPQLDYAALGHIHRHQRLGDTPPLVYSGSLQRVDFGEEDDDKGFYVIDLDTVKRQGERVADMRFVPVQARRFLTVDVTVQEGDPDPTATVVAAISRHFIDDAVVRVRIDLPASMEKLLQDSEIRKALAPAHYVAAIAKNVERQDRVRLGRDVRTEGLTPLQALETYLDSKQASPGRRKLLMGYAERLIQEAAQDGEEGEDSPNLST